MIIINEQLKGLIRGVADNDLQKAKAYVRILLNEDKAACNTGFKNSILNKLNTPANNLLYLPSNIQGMLTIEDTSVSFDEKRYVSSNKDSNVVKHVLDIWSTNDKLTEYGIRYLNTLLLYGVSGCGKTMLGRYIAYKAGLPFAYINFSHLISSYLGTTGKNIKEVFDFISKNKYVFMLDEIDAVGLRRGSKQEVGEISRIVINLMQALDTLESGTIVIGATNRLDVIDEALLRRFSIQYEMTLPDYDMRGNIFIKYMDSIPNTTYTKYDVDYFALKTDSMSCAKIVSLLINNVVKCLVRNEKITGQALSLVDYDV